jgi:transcriptional regulator with XRE-family HTH domain
MTDREAFTITLPKYMDKAGITKSELAEAVGVSKSTVSCWVHGKAFPRIDVMQRIADVLGCETDDLTYIAKLRFAEPDPRPNNQDILTMLEARIITVSEDKELKELWASASPAAKKAALAVLRSMKENGG